MLRFAQKQGYALGIWTAGSISPRVRLMDQLLLSQGGVEIKWQLLWDGSRCNSEFRRKTWFSEPELIVRKPLAKIWKTRSLRRRWNRQNTLIVDDTPTTFGLYHGNGIWIFFLVGPERRYRQIFRLCEVEPRDDMFMLCLFIGFKTWYQHTERSTKEDEPSSRTDGNCRELQSLWKAAGL